MKKYFTSILLFTAYLFAAGAISAVVYNVGIIILVLVPFLDWENVDAIFKSLYSILIVPISSYIVLYIAMRRVGYKENTMYEGNPAKKLFISVIIANLLIKVIGSIVNIVFNNAYRTQSWIATLFIYITADRDDLKTFGSIEMLLEEHLLNNYSLFVVSDVLKSILSVLIMIFGFYMGYKKCEKDRQETMADERTSLT